MTWHVKNADCFARNLLCPIVVIKELGIENNVSKYMETFYISEPMASTSIHFIDSDLYYITNTNYSVVSDMFFILYDRLHLSGTLRL